MPLDGSSGTNLVVDSHAGLVMSAEQRTLSNMMADSSSAAKPTFGASERRAMRVTIASRIFDPEPSAASFRLGALALALSEDGHDVTVLTVKPPAEQSGQCLDAERPYRVRRFPVLRDRSGYVRGYLQYLSFDVPLLFRVLFGRGVQIIIAEPPPTTGFFVRLASAIRRTPYVYYAADIWSDGAAQTGAPRWVLNAVQRIEKFTMEGARTVLSVSTSLTDRLAELGVASNVLTVGNGVDARSFLSNQSRDVELNRKSAPEFIYAGIASEWHGAGIFVEALPHVLVELPDAKLRFIGGGSDLEALRSRAVELGVSHAVSMEPYIAPRDLGPILRDSTAAVASIRPGQGNEFTFPTKLYSAVLCGAPAVFAGVGPAINFLATEIDGVPLGIAVEIDPIAVGQAMLQIAQRDEKIGQRDLVAAWGMQNVSLSGVADRIVAELGRIVHGTRSY